MTEERPRPQYGEYATPEQQRAAGGAPVPHGRAPEPTTPAPGPPSAVVQPRPWDRILSIALLAFGLYNVITGVVQFRDLGAMLNQVYELQGVGSYTETALTAALGTVIVVSQVVIFLVTLTITMSLLRRAKLAFWVPLVGGALAGVIVMVSLLVLMGSDPAFIAYVNEMSATT
ncbi:hypothetical protein BH09ACT3_BH09ACT3_12910 [soil metagenome]